MDSSAEESNLVAENLSVSNEIAVRGSPKALVLLQAAMFCMAFAGNFSSAVFTDQLVYQACSVRLALNKTECDLLGKEHESPEVQALEARVQPYAADILMAEDLAASVLPAIINLFVGPWSDRFGRKPVLLFTYTGVMLSQLIITGVCYLSSWYRLDPWYYAISFVPLALSGASCIQVTCVFCYIADVTNEQERARKMSILEAILYGGMLLGVLSSSYILRMSSATTVFAISTGAQLLAILFIAVGVKESIRVSSEDQRKPWWSKMALLFRPRMLLDTFRTCFIRRPNYDRAIILMGIATLSGTVFACADYSTVFFLFLRKHFNWSVRKFSYYTSVETVLLLLGNLFVTYCTQKVLHLTEAGLAALGLFFWFLNSIAIAVAFESWHLYLAIVICSLKGITDPMTRALISNATPPDDVASVFAFSSTLEALMPLVAAPLYTNFYKSTLAWSPGAFSWISAGFYAMCYCLAMSVCVLQTMTGSTTYSKIN